MDSWVCLYSCSLLQWELIVDEPRVRKRTTCYNDNLAEMSDLGSKSDSGEDESKKGIVVCVKSDGGSYRFYGVCVLSRGWHPNKFLLRTITNTDREEINMDEDEIIM